MPPLPEIVELVHQRLARLPAVRCDVVERVVARLRTDGLPSPTALADAVIDEVLAPVRLYARDVAHGSVVASRCQSQAKRPT